MEGGVMKSRFGWVVCLVVLGVVGFGGQAGADHGLFAVGDEATIAAGGIETGCEAEDGRRIDAERLRVNGPARPVTLACAACGTGFAGTWVRESGSAPIPGRDREIASTTCSFLDKGVQGAGHLRLDASPAQAPTPLHGHLVALADVHTPKSFSLSLCRRSGRTATE